MLIQVNRTSRVSCEVLVFCVVACDSVSLSRSFVKHLFLLLCCMKVFSLFGGKFSVLCAVEALRFP